MLFFLFFVSGYKSINFSLSMFMGFLGETVKYEELKTRFTRSLCYFFFSENMNRELCLHHAYAFWYIVTTFFILLYHSGLFLLHFDTNHNVVCITLYFIWSYHLAARINTVLLSRPVVKQNSSFLPLSLIL